MPAFYAKTCEAFLRDDPAAIMGALILGAGGEGIGEHQHQQTASWTEQVALLKSSLSEVCKSEDTAGAWGVLLEYTIPRRQRRIDAVILAHDIIFVLEFKPGKQADAAALRQVESYALDLRDFHAESKTRTIIPILVPAKMEIPSREPAPPSSDQVQGVSVVAPGGLGRRIRDLCELLRGEQDAISLSRWDAAPYAPIPTIIEAAETLFAGHSVKDISTARTSSSSLRVTADTLSESVKWAQDTNKKLICFITGVPGAGKTLVGLTLAHDPSFRVLGGSPTVFLSGNGPLVQVLRAALIKDGKKRRPGKNNEVSREAGIFIQNVHNFIRENVAREDPPVERAIIFDEAQRAWDAKKQKSKFGRALSEADLLLSIMSRHKGWAVLIALVGGGQEIHDGEAGLEEWGRALAEQHPTWAVLVSPEVLTGGTGLAGHRLFNEVPAHLLVKEERSLHLSESVRTFRSERVSRWVDAVLEGNPFKAREIFSAGHEYPIVLTRSLQSAREWLKEKTRGERRCGLLASSGAMRLRAEGIEVSSGFRGGYPYPAWFLGEPGDLRSSFRLEVAATEFECQGLELDWVGLCWGGDLMRTSQDQWLLRNLRGSRWTREANPLKRQYRLNKYRVLMTRAREGFVIWIPSGRVNDATIEPELLDSTARYLESCGVPLVG